MSLVFTVLPFSRASSESVRGGCGRSDPKTARRQSDDNCSSHGIPRGNSDNACTFSPVREHPPRHEKDELEEASVLQDIAHMPARVKCAVLGWHTMQELLKTEEK